MKKLYRLIVIALLLALSPIASPVFAQQNVIVVDSTPVVKSYTTIVDTLEAHQLAKLKTVVDQALRVMETAPPANATPETLAAFEIARASVVTAIITFFPGSG